MRFLAALLLLAGCDAVVAPQARYDPGTAGSVDQAMCRLGFTAVPLRTLVTGHHLVDARLNDRPARMIVDTGANVTVLHADYASQFGIEARPVRLGGVIGIGGGRSVNRGKIDSLVVGGVTLRQDAIVTTDLSAVSKSLAPLSGGPIHGIVGQDVLRDHHGVIDVARALLYIVPGRERPRPDPDADCPASGQAAERPTSR